MTGRRSTAAGALSAALMVVLALVLATASAVAAKPRAKAHHRKPKPVGSLGTVHFEPIAAAREAAAAKAALGPWLSGIEIGNEPNSYAQHAMREEPWTFTQYGEQVAAYRAAIEAAAPGIPLIGPDVSGSAA